MSDLRDRIARLSPQERALFEYKLSPQREITAASFIPRRADGGAVPLSFAQERIVFLQQLQPAAPLFNNAKALRLKGPLDVGALHQSLRAVVARHEILRSTISLREGHLVQEVRGNSEVPLPVIDLSIVSVTDREAALQRHLVEAAGQPFDLARGPLLRVTLLRLDERDHGLLIVVHHVTSDGWSMGILFHEVATCYEAFCSGKSPSLPELSIQYGDFVVWQRDRLQGQLLDRELSHWKRVLAGVPPALSLPTSHSRQCVRTARGGRAIRHCSAELANALKALSASEGATLFMTLLAAFLAVCYRYTGQGDLAICCPIFGRSRLETEDLIGPFINTLVLRTDLSGDPTFRELVRRIRGVALEAYAHRELPFEVLLQHLQPERDGSQTSLFQVSFQAKRSPHKSIRLPGLELEWLEVDTGTAKLDLSVEILEDGDGLTCCWEYNAGLFEAATVQRMLSHFIHLLGGAVTDPDQPVSRLPLLLETERHRILREWNGTRTDYPRGRSLAQLFEDQVRRAPGEVAVRWGTKDLTYSELNQRANRLAHYLRGLGVEPETPVGVCVERSPEMIVSVLGVVKAGGSYVPLDPDDPVQRMADVLKDVQAPLILTQARLRGRLPDTGARLVCLDADWPIIAQADANDPTAVTTDENLACILFTSGSTGQPKGACIVQRGVIRLVCNTDYVQLMPADSVAQVSAFAFDAATFEIWGALLNGSRLVGIPKEVILSPHDFAARLRTEAITAMMLTPALFNVVARQVPTAFRTMRHLLLGGEVVDPQSIRVVLENGPPARLLNAYGPTETTTFATWYLIQAIPPDSHSIPIGRPIANTEVYILDAETQPVPVGVAGEVYIGGDGLARGYCNRPGLTAERFVPHSFSTAPGARLYRTGDLARFLPDGNIEFLGRVDHQVKIRGFRIEPEEIELSLVRHPALQGAAVVVREDVPGDKRLVAYVVPGPGQQVGVAELRGFLVGRLPRYMIPSTFVVLERFPLTTTGKVNRQALPAPRSSIDGAETARVAPRDDLERRIVKIWEDLLGIHPIGTQDNFFDAGGHSLLAARMLGLMEKEFGRSLPVATIFLAPTIEQLASILRERERSEGQSAVVPYQTRGNRPPFFFVQVPGFSVSLYRTLAERVGSDQPFYGLQPSALGNGNSSFLRVENAAAQFLQEIRSIQFEGPFYLGGHSFGSLVAYEMAQHLITQGQRVALLAVLDTPRPGYPRGGERFRMILQRLRRMSAQEKLSHLSASGRRHAEQLLVKAAFWGVFRLGLPLSGTLRGRNDGHAYLAAAQEYRITPYPERLTLFRAQFRDILAHDPHLWWDDLAQGGIEVHGIPGGHVDCVCEPHVQVLARTLRECLLRPQARNMREAG